MSMDQNNTQNQKNNNIAKKTNTIILAATSLLTVLTKLKYTQKQPDVVKLRRIIIEEIKMMQKRLMEAQYPMPMILASQYCICTAIDEIALSSEWGTQSIWIEQSLLTLFFKETWGGERFYGIIDKFSREPDKNIEFLEFVYVILSVGFEGKYFGKQRNYRDEIRNRIFYLIRNFRNKPDKSITGFCHDERPITERKYRTKRLKMHFILSALVLFMSAGFFNWNVYMKAIPLFNKLQSIATVSSTATFSQVIERSLIERGVN